MDNEAKKLEEKKAEKTPNRAPDEKGSFLVQGHLKIVDPESGEILVNQRG